MVAMVRQVTAPLATVEPPPARVVLGQRLPAVQLLAEPPAVMPTAAVLQTVPRQTVATPVAWVPQAVALRMPTAQPVRVLRAALAVLVARLVRQPAVRVALVVLLVALPVVQAAQPEVHRVALVAQRVAQRAVQGVHPAARLAGPAAQLEAPQAVPAAQPVAHLAALAAQLAAQPVVQAAQPAAHRAAGAVAQAW